MRDLIVIGAGDFARETIWIAERMNLQFPQWNILGFADDGKEAGSLVDGYPILGSLAWLQDQNRPIYAVCAIGTAKIRRQIWVNLKNCSQIRPATLVDPTVIIGKDSEIGAGCILCAGTILAIGVNIGAHCIVNLGCILGHDAVMGNCCTVHPRADLSGNVKVGACTDIGAGAIVRDEVTIGQNCIIGMGSLVTRDIPPGVVAYGTPCRVIRENKDGNVFK